MNVYEPMQAYEYNPNPKYEVTISNSLLQAETESHVGDEDLQLSIVIRKRTRECTNDLYIYNLANFLSFKILTII